eukprot:scaffold4518_cov410-Prasinococcus_capsulatus_cf.AAC.23
MPRYPRVEEEDEQGAADDWAMVFDGPHARTWRRRRRRWRWPGGRSYCSWGKLGEPEGRQVMMMSHSRRAS